MKYVMLSVYGLLILLSCNCTFCQGSSDNPVNPSDGPGGSTIEIRTTPELSNLTADWIRGYEKENPGVAFSVKTFNGSEINKEGTICFVPDDYAAVASDWKISIGHDVVVPVFNAKNPMFKAIADQGLSASDFALVYSGSGPVNWSDLIKNGPDKPVNPYIIDNAAVKAGVSNFIQKETASLHVRLIVNASDFIAAIQTDPYAMGFCRLPDILGEGSGGIVENIRLLPVDKNRNGRLDNFESIFNSPDDLLRGVWVGKYPHALSGSILAISHSVPTDKKAIAFLAWIMGNGGKYLTSNGYGDLIGLEKQANLAILSPNPGNDAILPSHRSMSWLFFLGLAIMGILLAVVITRIFTKTGSTDIEQVFNPVPALNEITVSSPEGFYYDRTHTWSFMERDGSVRLGIDDFLQHVTGTITRVMMKNAGEYVQRGEKILTLIKFGKQLSLYSPVSGIIIARNLKLDENSSLVNTSPYSEGWVYLIEPKNWIRELQFMWMGEKYRDWLKEEFIRLRNFFENTLKEHHDNLEYSLLQDGGELRDNLLAELGPEVWEEFQRKFIDKSR
jgi:glycine cleavage system H lipoate-binding protein/ABC-type phosphate transport system substrate-binding protein